MATKSYGPRTVFVFRFRSIHTRCSIKNIEMRAGAQSNRSVVVFIERKYTNITPGPYFGTVQECSCRPKRRIGAAKSCAKAYSTPWSHPPSLLADVCPDECVTYKYVYVLKAVIHLPQIFLESTNPLCVSRRRRSSAILSRAIQCSLTALRFVSKHVLTLHTDENPARHLCLSLSTDHYILFM